MRRSVEAYPTQWTTGRYLFVGIMVLATTIMFERLISWRYTLRMGPHEFVLHIDPWLDRQGVRIDTSSGCCCVRSVRPSGGFYCESWCDRTRYDAFFRTDTLDMGGGCDNAERCRDVTGHTYAPVEFVPPAAS